MCLGAALNVLLIVAGLYADGGLACSAFHQPAVVMSLEKVNIAPSLITGWARPIHRVDRRPARELHRGYRDQPRRFPVLWSLPTDCAPRNRITQPVARILFDRGRSCGGLFCQTDHCPSRHRLIFFDPDGALSWRQFPSSVPTGFGCGRVLRYLPSGQPGACAHQLCLGSQVRRSIGIDWLRA